MAYSQISADYRAQQYQSKRNELLRYKFPSWYSRQAVSGAYRASKPLPKNTLINYQSKI
tara:strand:+ start:1128 stop:1304 length:177 start_codon:yes stop_codon:yes gene_type:complete